MMSPRRIKSSGLQVESWKGKDLVLWTSGMDGWRRATAVYWTVDIIYDGGCHPKEDVHKRRFFSCYNAQRFESQKTPDLWIATEYEAWRVNR